METSNRSTPSNDSDSLDQITADQNADVLHAELNLRPERYWQVLVPTYFAGLTSQQIADQMQLTKGVVAGRIREARNTRRVWLARRGIALSVLTTVLSPLYSSEAAVDVVPDLFDITSAGNTDAHQLSA